MVVLPLEGGKPRLYLIADTEADELRLRSWLRHTSLVRQIPQLVDQLLDDLDRRDAERTA